MTDTLQEQQIVSSEQQDVEYIVQTGDTLAKIAQVYYGSESGWSKIHQANLDAIGENPHELQVGVILNIPA
ncbi:MAG: LysM peptidoglycan-binding domain-containing protein [Calothrix sp. MO_192.B10]|nr:LysM peptidoglycan-binding domain-containing protein [Calothrix sp. MO_192.B10]